MKLLFAGLGLFIALFTTSLSPVQAHQLKASGSVGAVLHVEPDDDPIVGRPSTFLLEFKDKNEQFQLDRCVCTVTVSRNGQELTRLPIQPTNSVSYTFPEKGVYKVTVEGKPLGDAAFAPFSVSYDIRVTRESTQFTSSSTKPGWLSLHGIHLLLILLVSAYTIYRIHISSRELPNKTKKKGDVV